MTFVEKQIAYWVNQARKFEKQLDAIDERIEHLQQRSMDTYRDYYETMSALEEGMDPEDFNDEFGYYPPSKGDK